MPTTTTTKQTKAATLAFVQALMAGTKQHFPNGSFTLGNTAYTTATLLQVLQALADALTALNAAQLNVKDAMAATVGMKTKVGPVIQAYHRFLLAAFSNATQTLADFGITPPKARTPLTAEQKAAAVAKLRATRKARGTTSKKQKLAVSGNVTGVVVTPVTAPEPSPSPAQPAPTAPSAAAPAASVTK